MPRFVSGVLPISHAKTSEKVDEERRMAYVGITRARKFLELSWGETYKYLDQTRNQSLSPFEAYLRSLEPPKPLREPPQTRIVSSIRSGSGWGFQPPEKSGSVPFDPLIDCTFVEGSQIAVGVRISHPEHGLGTIDTVKNSYTIAEFDSGRRFKVKFRELS